MRRRQPVLILLAIIGIGLSGGLAPCALAQEGAAEGATNDGELDVIRAEIERLRQSYEAEIAQLEQRLRELEERQQAAEDAQPAPQRTAQGPAPATASGRAAVTNNAFNPAIGVIFNGRFGAFKRDPENFRIDGFPLGGETGPGPEGFALDETELNFSANVSDLFYASTTAAIDAGDDGVEVDLEEAFFQTLTLPHGLTLKGGRFFAALGYLNENHSHTDSFSDRPLPYQAFLAGQYNDEGVQLSMVLPTELYVQFGAGLFRGRDFPAGGAANGGTGAYSGFLRLGGDIGFSSSWRLGLSYLHAEARGRETGPEDAAPTDLLRFDGDTDLLVADAKFQWAPGGNATDRQLTLQGEYIRRSQQGAFNGIAYDGDDSGWYLQGVYKFARGWRAGYRFARLSPEDNIPLLLQGTALDGFDRNPYAHSAMIDWAHNEFSVLRLQVARDLSQAQADNRLTIQYVMSIGAHGAHNF